MREQTLAKIWLLFFLVIFLLPSKCHASSLLTAVPEKTSITMPAFTNTPFQINLTNYYQFPVYNVTFDNPYISASPISSLGVNTSYSKSTTLYTTSTFDTNTIITIKFDYYTNYTTQPQNYNVDIGTTYFSPSSRTIRSGDTVTFHNTDSITHTITCSLFVKSLSTGETWTYTFNNPGSVRVDDSLNFYLYLTVENSAQQILTHNPDYDQTINMHIASYLQQTSLTAEMIDSSLNITYGGSNQGLIKLTNSGGFDAMGIMLSSSKWITFGTNNFTMSPGQNKYVLYTATPSVTDSSQTNKTHTIPITIKGLNIPDISKSIDVFVSYHYLENISNLTYQEVQLEVNRLKALLEKYLNQPQLNQNQTVIYLEKTFPVNYSAMDVYELNRAQIESKDALMRTENEIKMLTDWSNTLYKSDVSNILNRTDTIAKDVQRNKESQETNRAIIFFVIVMAIIGGIAFFGYKYAKKRYAVQEVQLAYGLK